jgi:putative hydrolase of the HAD superfamily
MSLTSDIQAVTFDVGGTLIECWPSVGHVYAEVAARHTARKFSPTVLNRRFAAAWRAQKSFEHTRADWAALVDATFDGLVSAPPSQTFFEELYGRFSQPEAWHIFEDVLPALETLSARGLKLGIISNWDERLIPLLRKLGLAQRFETIVVSCEIAASKPSPLIFREAAQRLSVPPASILHVGDSPDADAAGAIAAGLQAVLLQRAPPSGPPMPQCPCISSLRELRSVMGAIRSH